MLTSAAGSAASFTVAAALLAIYGGAVGSPVAAAAGVSIAAYLRPHNILFVIPIMLLLFWGPEDVAAVPNDAARQAAHTIAVLSEPPGPPKPISTTNEGATATQDPPSTGRIGSSSNAKKSSPTPAGGARTVCNSSYSTEVNDMASNANSSCAAGPPYKHSPAAASGKHWGQIGLFLGGCIAFAGVLVLVSDLVVWQWAFSACERGSVNHPRSPECMRHASCHTALMRGTCSQNVLEESRVATWFHESYGGILEYGDLSANIGVWWCARHVACCT
jgi:hypothetical protein